MMILENLTEEVRLLLQFLIALFILVIASLFNYIKSLDKETLINDIQLLTLIIRGERIMFKEDGRWIVVKGHKRVCEDCIHTHCINCRFIEVPIDTTGDLI